MAYERRLHNGTKHRAGRSLTMAAALLVSVLTTTLLAPLNAAAQTNDPAATSTPSAAPTALVDHAKKIVLPGDLPGVASAAWDLAVTPNAVWVLGIRSGEAVRLDPDTGRVVKRVALPAGGCLPQQCNGRDRIVADAHDAWVVSNGARVLVHIDVRRNTVSGTVPITGGGAPAAPVIDSSGVWLTADPTQSDIVHVDARTTQIDKTAHIGTGLVWPMAVIDGTLWVSGATVSDFGAPPSAEAMYRIDPKNATVVGTVPGMSGLGAALGDQLWISRSCCPSVTSTDGRTGAPGTDIDVHGGNFFLTTGGGFVWMRMFSFDRSSHWIARINPRDNTLTRIDLPASPVTGGIAFGHGAVWVTSWNENAVYRMKATAR